VATAFAPGMVHADVQIKMDLPALESRAERIVRAHVTGVHSAWNADHSFIYTQVTLDVAETYKGKGAATVTVRVPGGKVGNYRISATSMPEFSVGDDVVVFLTRWHDGAFKVAGYAQGLSRISASPTGPVLRGGTLHLRRVDDVERELRRGTSRP
jgi:hypothetical protein